MTIVHMRIKRINSEYNSKDANIVNKLFGFHKKLQNQRTAFM